MNQQLALISDAAMFVALIVYVLALAAFAVERAVLRHRPPVEVPAVVRVGAPTAIPPRLAPVPGGHTRRQIAGRAAALWLVVATALHTLAVGLRAAATGAMPLGNMYEFVTASALAASLTYLIVARAQPVIRSAGLYLAGAMSVALGSAITGLYAQAGPLIPALRSYWLLIHVTAAVVAFGAFTLGAITSGLFLRARHRGVAHGPSAAALDLLAKRLHARATRGWGAHRVAAIAIGAYACLLFNLVGVNLLFSSLHSYAGL
ncbi:cytochrome c biogenesis protein [Streptosporangium sp. LJ11]|uniref:cytochrome c biogenesis protein n=1 Tax=Streptosporangium sp. LJ11 TaxID=3436927 RepID=UPI003F799787